MLWGSSEREVASNCGNLKTEWNVWHDPRDRSEQANVVFREELEQAVQFV